MKPEGLFTMFITARHHSLSWARSFHISTSNYTFVTWLSRART